jgi:hypothetical protein
VQAVPVDMILHCPKCGTQHIDKPFKPVPGDGEEWTNRPHRSHLCHVCGCIWRPADVPTNGVASIQTSGKDDTWFMSVPVAPAASPAPSVGSAAPTGSKGQPTSEGYTRERLVLTTQYDQVTGCASFESRQSYSPDTIVLYHDNAKADARRIVEVWNAALAGQALSPKGMAQAVGGSAAPTYDGVTTHPEFGSAAPKDEREAFEAFMRREEPTVPLIRTRADGEYDHLPTAAYWQVWQARATLSSHPAKEEFDFGRALIAGYAQAAGGGEEGGPSGKELWWAGYRAGKGLPANTPRQQAVAAAPGRAGLEDALRQIAEGRVMTGAVIGEKAEYTHADTVMAYQKLAAQALAASPASGGAQPAGYAGEGGDNSLPRFFMDHGTIHDRMTGQHVTSEPDTPYQPGVAALLALLNQLSALGAPAAPAGAPSEAKAWDYEKDGGRLIGYDECRCVLSQYCDGKCRPIFDYGQARAPLPAVAAPSPAASGGNAGLREALPRIQAVAHFLEMRQAQTHDDDFGMAVGELKLVIASLSAAPSSGGVEAKRPAMREGEHCQCSQWVVTYGHDVKPGERHHRDCKHWHREIGEAIVTKKEFLVLGDPPNDDEAHDCDRMGCGSFSHVVFRMSLAEAAPHLGLTVARATPVGGDQQ